MKILRIDPKYAPSCCSGYDVIYLLPYKALQINVLAFEYARSNSFEGFNTCVSYYVNLIIMYMLCSVH